jgi:hypothetical protein
VTDTPQTTDTDVVPPDAPAIDTEPFILIDGEGNGWTLSAWREGNHLDDPVTRLVASTVAPINGIPFAITGEQLLVGDHDVLGRPHLTSLLPRGGGLTGGDVPCGVRPKARSLVERALTPDRCLALAPRALELTQLDTRSRMRVSDASWVALASASELRAEVCVLEDWLRPGGPEDQFVTDLEAKIASTRPNSGRKRQRIREMREALAARPVYREMQLAKLAACRRRLAELG